LEGFQGAPGHPHHDDAAVVLHYVRYRYAIDHKDGNKMIRTVAILPALVFATCSAAVVLSASAERDYPNRAIKIVVPIPPGGFADALPRLIAEKLSALWGQPVVIENRPGAGLNIGAEIVAKAEPSGYTLLATPPGPLVTNRFLYKHLGYDPAGFVPVTILAKAPFVLVARPDLPVNSLRDLIAYAKSHPDKLNFASSGVGSPPHLAMESLKAEAGIRMMHVPYKGLTPALTDVVAGRVDLMFHDPASTLPQIRAGKLKPLGVGSAARLPKLPDVPAIAEVLPGFAAETWYALVAPPKTPAAIVAKISRATTQILRLPEVAQRLSSFSVAVVGSSPDVAATFVGAEAQSWRRVIDAAGIRAN